jgi:hypothetical protein
VPGWDYVTSLGSIKDVNSFIVAYISSFSTDVDVGSPSSQGSANYNNGIYTVRGSGANGLYWNSDSFNFLYTNISNNAQIIAHINPVQYNNWNASAGVVIRGTTDPGSNSTAIVLNYHGDLCSETRTTLGADGNATQTCANNNAASFTSTIWVKLVRSGSSFSSYYSNDGTSSSWILISTVNVTMGNSVFIGLEASSYNSSVLNASTFDSVSIN